MSALTSLVVRLSRSRRAVVIVLIAFVVVSILLGWAGHAFRSATGLEPFDLQNGLTAQEVSAQLAQYDDDATGRYVVFTIVDWVFPLLGGLLTAVITAACLRNSLPRVYERAVSWRLFALFFLPTLFDWTENIFALWIVLEGFPPADGLVDAMLVAKRVKLVTLYLVQAVTVLSILAWLVAAARRRLVAPQAQ